MKELNKRRTDKLARKEADKKVRALNTEYQNTYRSWQDSYQDLDEPLRRGFKRNLVLKPSVYRRSDFDVFESLLPIIDTCHTSHTREFKSYDHKTGRMSKEFVHRAKALSQKDYDKLSQRQKAYFDAVWIHSKWGVKGWYEYRFAHESLLISKMSKWFVTRVPILDPDNDSRNAELRNVMYGARFLMRKVDRLLDTSWNRRDDYIKSYERHLKRVEMRESNESLHCFGVQEDDDIDDVNQDYDYKEWCLEIGFF